MRRLLSGGYRLQPSEPTPKGVTITIQTSGDFLGYKQAFYDVAPGFWITFATADTVIDGVRKLQATPRVPLFPLPLKGAQQVRLLYLVRSSVAHHNRAILAAPDHPRLQAVTESVRANPSTACSNSRQYYCAWVPPGIAHRPL